MKSNKIDVPRLFALAAAGHSRREIAEMLGIRSGSLHALLQRYGVQPKRVVRSGVPTVDPTPDQIAERAAAVRAGWSDAERHRRAGGSGVVPAMCREYLWNSQTGVFSGMDH